MSSTAFGDEPLNFLHM